MAFDLVLHGDGKPISLIKVSSLLFMPRDTASSRAREILLFYGEHEADRTISALGIQCGEQMRRDAAAMLFWALRWHEGRSVSYKALGDLLWSEFAQRPIDPAPSLRELMTYVEKRYADKWTISDNGRGFCISPRLGTGVPRKVKRSPASSESK